MTSPAPHDPQSSESVAARRARYRQSRRRRANAIAATSTAAVIALVGWQAVSAPGWHRARTAFLDAEIARSSLPAVGEGLLLNVQVWLGAGAISLIAGLGIALVRTTAGAVLFPLRMIAVAYVDVLRGVPLLLVIYLVGFGLPALRLTWLPASGVFLAALAIVLTYTAYIAEIFRAGIESVHPSQVAAARALGLTSVQAMRFVVVPQAVRNVTAPLASTLVALQKDSGLISILGAVDAIRAAEIASAGSYNFTPYVVAGALFLAVSIPLTRAVDAYGARHRHGLVGGVR